MTEDPNFGAGSTDGARQRRIPPVCAETVAERAMLSRSVHGLYAGGAVEVATYLPGKRISGVRIRESEVEVHVVARWGTRLMDVAEEVRELVSPVTGDLPVSVFIDDVSPPDG